MTSSAVPRTTWDHPRSRGEHCGSTSRPRSPTGSPPLARGAPHPRPRPRRSRGITPARAGSTCGSSVLLGPTVDHPRSRGEHRSTVASTGPASGSPPLARGAPGSPPRWTSRVRITPARAGSTRVASVSSSRMTGSPPLARGALVAEQAGLAGAGITPARAGSTGRSACRAAPSRDHPRSRGEHNAVVTTALRRTGSPPLARGARGGLPARVRRRWITPARAGSTARSGRAGAPSRDHPRSRGEHDVDAQQREVFGGSPPLARGAPGHGASQRRRPGITPARAGSTTWRRAPRTSGGDHPRSRGEHTAPTGEGELGRGSPPLARGAPRRVGSSTDQRRITPARAGSTAVPDRGPGHRADHPRSRGEHARSNFSEVASSGSPPLARGALHDQGHDGRGVGITPARAGSTGRGDRTGRGWRDHPRSRGEHRTWGSNWSRVAGSPPLARGALHVLPPRGRALRITPARAGSTRGRELLVAAVGDHPGSRGEHRRLIPTTDWQGGSPPLARGARPLPRADAARRGITPARAGSTRAAR